MSRYLRACLASSLLAIGASATAKEGMFTPEQLPEIASDLKKTGLDLNPSNLTNLTGFPMGAVVSLGGCSASFVSEQGLVVTNHHCARGSVQFNSTAENNYLADGFLAKSFDQELPAAPGSRIYVTVEFDDVTDKIIGDLPVTMGGRERYDAIESRQKALIAECEAEPGYRCSVPAFFEGMEYKLIKQLEIRDVRIAYAPADSIGKYGGDIDNWMWPRHTGDFAFYRAYVGPDGKPADFSEDNVPFKPEHVLTVSAKGVEEGDFVMVAGYPGSTNRYARLSQVEYVFDWFYPTYIDVVTEWIATIEQAAPKGSDARIKYESLLAGLNNFLKNTHGQVEGAQRVGLVDRRRAREDALSGWLAQDASRRDMAASITELDVVRDKIASNSKQNFWYNNMTRASLLSAAQTLYRNAIEREKPDAEREPGFQERDRTRLEQGMKSIDRRFDSVVDGAVWKMFMTRYNAEAKSGRIQVLDDFFGLRGGALPADIDTKLDRLYQTTKLDDVDNRIRLLTASKAELEASEDPFIKLAIALYPVEMDIENRGKTLSGEADALLPEYMQAIIAWQKSQGTITYPDANSTLRVTYGTVMGGSPKDGLIYEPFTRVEGIVEKDTGKEPFDSPKSQLALIEAKEYGEYALESLGTVPVNFLSDLDTTGGNSGSATLNSKAELVGLLFDGTIESVNSDWDFDPRTTRSIHVDTRYMLWVMEKVDGAQNLINEMKIAK